MKKFQKPEIEVIDFKDCDVVACSGEVGPGSFHPTPPGPPHPPGPIGLGHGRP